VALTVNTGVVMGLSFFAAQYLQLVVGLSPLEAGLWTLPMTIAGIPAALLTPSLVRYVRPAYVMAAGLLVAAVGFALVTQVDGSGLAMLVSGTVVMFVGLAVMGVLGTDMAVGAAPPEQAGAASAVTETGNELGGALGLALLGSIGGAVYSARIDDSSLSGVPEAAVETAGGSLGGAVSVVGDLPARIGDGLLETARGAYLSSLHVVALVCCALVVVLAVAVAVLLRGIGRQTEEGTEAASAPVPATEGAADR